MKLAPALLAIALGACAAGVAQMAPPSTAAPQSRSASSAESPRVCLDVRHITNRVAISDTQVRFDMDNGESWTNTLKSECPGLRFNNGFSWDVTGGQVCANAQTIYVLDRNTPCQLGDFTQVTRP